MTVRTMALAVAALALAACGGGGSSTSGGGKPPDPEAALGALLDRSDTLLFSAVHSRWSVALDDETVEDASADPMVCAGARCTAADGTMVAVGDLAAAAAARAGARRGSRGGFDTVSAAQSFELEEVLGGVTVTAASEAQSWGFWGAHGFAALSLGTGPLSGEAQGAPFSGTFGFASAYAVGEASGSNPAGVGSATWTGIAEATAKDTFARLRGTATVTVADLSRPRVGVAIDVPGQNIGAPGWADMALDKGRFASGSAGSDWIAGSFHGPGHEEAWGVFDTTGHVGAFGAKRQ